MNILDIIGPVMVGPSSSHTAGAARIGYVARKLLAAEPVSAQITLYGSFARTYRGHGTDKALIAGILGMKPDDERLPDSLEIAKERSVDFSFRVQESEPGIHPNTARIDLAAADGSTVSVEGASVGGGNILITHLNGMESVFTGSANTLIIPHHDEPGVIAVVAQTLALYNVNIGNFRQTRARKGAMAMMTIEVDSDVPRECIELLRKQPHIAHVVYLHINTDGGAL